LRNGRHAYSPPANAEKPAKTRPNAYVLARRCERVYGNFVASGTFAATSGEIRVDRGKKLMQNLPGMSEGGSDGIRGLWKSALRSLGLAAQRRRVVFGYNDRVLNPEHCGVEAEHDSAFVCSSDLQKPASAGL
jgi:hypothetical protein